jgi:RNA polymerase sigma-70 factor (ECF subfamily)
MPMRDTSCRSDTTAPLRRDRLVTEGDSRVSKNERGAACDGSTHRLIVPMPDADDFADWCRRLRASDREAYAAVFEATYEPLFRYVQSLTKERAAARDLTQETFVRLWDARETLDPSQSLKAYLYRTARNLAYNHRRNAETHSEKEDDIRENSNARPAAPHPPDVAAEGEWLEEKLWTWIADLPDRQRDALVLSRFEGLTHEQIAEVMGISDRTVNNHIVRALKRLRTRVQDYEPDLLNRHES